MTNVPSVRAELAAVDEELRRLDGHRHELLARRAHLVSLLTHAAAQSPRAVAGRAAAGSAAGSAARPVAPAARPAARPREVAPHGAQNALLTLGGTLLAIAAVAFTVVSWGSLGDGGRTAVLTVVTLAALAVPAVLLRGRLVATAQTVSVLALVLTVLDAVGVAALARPSDGFAYVGGAALVLTAVWTAYGLLVPALAVPLPAAVFAGQFVPLSWALAAGAAPSGLAWALLATGMADAAVALLVTRPSVRIPAALAAAGAGGWGMFAGWWFSVSAPSAARAVLPGLLLLTGAGAVVVAALRERRLAVPAAVVAVLSAVAAVGNVARHAVPGQWAVAVYLACALAAATGARLPLPRAAARAVAATAAGLALCCTLWALPVPLLVLASATAGATGAGGAFALPAAAAPLVLAVAAALPLCGRRWLPGTLWPDAGRPAAGAAVAARGSAATALGLCAVAALPAAPGLGYAATFALLLALVAALLAVAVRPSAAVAGATASTGAAGAVLCALSLVGLSWSARWSLLLSLGALTALFAVVAALGGPGSRRAPVVARAVLGCLSVVCATAFAAAVPATAGHPAADVAYAVLLVPAVVAALSARPGLRPAPVGVPVEAAGAAAGVVAVVCAAAGGPRALALVLALCALIAAGTALRPGRRRAGTCAAAVLLTASLWVWLAQSGVSAPEAYTLPVAVPLLAAGVLRRGSDREASSWAAYGPGLALALVPALGAAWVDAHWARPLLLGLAALGVTLVGGRRRLLAPLLLGGGALVLDALHELAPYVVQVAGLVPRWVPMALVGLALLGLGATYERRLRDARRLREVLNGMR